LILQIILFILKFKIVHVGYRDEGIKINHAQNKINFSRACQEVDLKRVYSNLDPEIPMICVCGNCDVGNRDKNIFKVFYHPPPLEKKLSNYAYSVKHSWSDWMFVKRIKGIVRICSSHPLCKNGPARWCFKNICLIFNVENIVGFLGLKQYF